MKRYPIAISTSDWHLNSWTTNNPVSKPRLEHQLDFLEYLCTSSHQLEIPILFSGDLFHNAKTLTNELFDKVSERFNQCFNDYPKARILAISGNHDQSEKNFRDTLSPSYVASLSRVFPHNFICLDFKNIVVNNVRIAGIPYLTHNVGLQETVEDYSELEIDILLIHTDLHGAKDTNLYQINDAGNVPKNMDEFFEQFKLVLSGHIHLPQRLGKNLYMVGAPMHQRKTDVDAELGYWVVYSDFKVEFTHVDWAPQFKIYEEGDKIDDFHIWLLAKQRKEAQKKASGFDTENLSRISLIKMYIEKMEIPMYPHGKALIKHMEELEDDII